MVCRLNVCDCPPVCVHTWMLYAHAHACVCEYSYTWLACMSWSVWLSVREYVYVCARACVCVCVRANVFHQIRTETRCCLQDRNISSVAGAGEEEALTLPLPNPEHGPMRATLINGAIIRAFHEWRPTSKRCWHLVSFETY